MSEVQLLNAPVEAAVCNQMMEAVASRLLSLEHHLGTYVLDREIYLQKMGAANELRSVHNDLQTVYERNFKA